MGLTVPLFIPLEREKAPAQPDGQLLFRFRNAQKLGAAFSSSATDRSTGHASLSTSIRLASGAHSKSTGTASLAAPVRPAGVTPTPVSALYVPIYREPPPAPPDSQLLFRFRRSAPGPNLIGSAKGSSVARAGSSLTSFVLEAANSTSTSSAKGALTTWTTVTLAAPLYTGRGSICDPSAPWSNGAPGPGAVVYYDGTNLTILQDAEIVATSGSPYIFWAQAQWSPSPGVWSELTIEFTKGPVGSPSAKWASTSGLSTQIPVASHSGSVVGSFSSIVTNPLPPAHGYGVEASSAPLSTAIALASSSRAASRGVSSLTTQIVVVASGHARSSATGEPSGHAALASLSLSVARTHGAAGNAQLFASVSQARSSGSASASTAIRLSAHGRSKNIGTAAGITFAVRFQSASGAVSHASASLSTSIPLEGTGASVSNAIGVFASTPFKSYSSSSSSARFVPTVPPRFGWAEVVALSQSGVQPDEPAYVEGSAVYVQATYFDSTGVPFVPNAVSYRVDDVSSGVNIAPFQSMIPGTTNVFVIPSSENYMVNATRDSEEHEVLLQIIDGFGDASYEFTRFYVIRVAGLG